MNMNRIFPLLLISLVSTISIGMEQGYNPEAEQKLAIKTRIHDLIKPINGGRTSAGAQLNCTLVAEECVKVLAGVKKASQVHARKKDFLITGREKPNEEIVYHEAVRPEQASFKQFQECIETINLENNRLEKVNLAPDQPTSVKYITTNRDKIAKKIKKLACAADSSSSTGFTNCLAGIVYYYYKNHKNNAGHMANFYRDEDGNVWFVDAQNIDISETPPTKIKTSKQTYTLKDEMFYFPYYPNGMFVKQDPQQLQLQKEESNKRLLSIKQESTNQEIHAPQAKRPKLDLNEVPDYDEFPIEFTPMIPSPESEQVSAEQTDNQSESTQSTIESEQTTVQQPLNSDPQQDFLQMPLNTQLSSIFNSLTSLSASFEQRFRAMNDLVTGVEKKVAQLTQEKTQQNLRVNQQYSPRISAPPSQKAPILGNMAPIMPQNNQNSLIQRIQFSGPSEQLKQHVQARLNLANQQRLQNSQPLVTAVQKTLNEVIQQADKAPKIKPIPGNPYINGVRSRFELLWTEMPDKKMMILIYNRFSGLLINSITLDTQNYKWLTFKHDPIKDKLIGVHTKGVNIFHDITKPDKVFPEKVNYDAAGVFTDASIYYQDDQHIYIAFLINNNVSINQLHISQGTPSLLDPSVLIYKSTLSSMPNKTFPAGSANCTPTCVHLDKNTLRIVGKINNTVEGYFQLFNIDSNYSKYEKLAKAPDAIIDQENNKVLYFQNNSVITKKESVPFDQRQLFTSAKNAEYNYAITVLDKGILRIQVYQTDSSKCINAIKQQCTNCKCLFVIGDTLVLIRNEGKNGIIELYKLPQPDFTQEPKSLVIQPYHQEKIPNTTLEWAFPLTDDSRRQLMYITQDHQSHLYTLPNLTFLRQMGQL